MSEEFSSKHGWTAKTNPEDIALLAAALATAQGDIDNVKKGAFNPHFKSKYANLASVRDSIRDELAKNGLSVTQFPCKAPDGFVGLRTILLHKSGQHIEDTFFMPVKDHNNPQAVGSALTYAQRYALMAVVGIAPEDDDGNAAKGGKPQTNLQSHVNESVDWTKASEDLLARASAETDSSKLRGMFSQVRNSVMPEPGKTSLLSSLEQIIQNKEKGGK